MLSYGTLSVQFLFLLSLARRRGSTLQVTLARAKNTNWLVQPTDNIVNIILLDYLITEKKLTDRNDWEDFVSQGTEFREDALGDLNLLSLRDAIGKARIIQFVNKGYCVFDDVDATEKLSNLSKSPTEELRTRKAKLLLQSEYHQHFERSLPWYK
ncbi:hypothetical protein Hypma_011069 [Hypsizygus marmoreus]|uniref:Uncharacterized protein n=1 Tax=Hypsizygus marmoreus TaxID=39966 RepID=A0A369JNP9_HYPMA|nr:hypothetical protein Hypma_011069 [Hypsizygus marmoreus]